ncbi:MAG: hydroxymethylglutaryl-CoA lyase [Oscillospiraceae bacterium]|nr:hydroxymethylglutaryl-CoA lyase [Oscillospiraceae bacterium]
MEKKKINIVEVGPRDGFQSVKGNFIPTELKKEIIDKLVDAGIRHMEYSSFVSPKAIPQLADAAEVTEYVLTKYPELDLMALVPNMRGATNAYNLGLRKVVNVVSFSASHNKANINRTHEESLNAFREMRETYPDLEIELDLATAFGCPFEGKGGKYSDSEALVEFLVPYREAGLRIVDLCDTIGIADPAQVKNHITALQKAYPDLGIHVHIHDTRGLGVANTLTAVQCGVTNIQTALGGLGGCPFAPGASGNLSTEDTVWMLNEMGYDTGISFTKILAAAKYEVQMIPDGNYSGHHIHVEKETPCCF